MIEFDNAKDASNLKKHGISLARANDFDFSTASSSIEDGQDYGEVRYQAIGFIGAMLHVLIYTVRIDALRAISLRSATKQEARQYAEEF